MPSNWRALWPLDKQYVLQQSRFPTLTPRSWLARIFVHFDANFRLVLARRERRDEDDKSLWSGPGFFVDSNVYQQYLRAAGEVEQEASSHYSLHLEFINVKDQKSNCVNHRAVLLTTMSRNSRLEITGVAGGVCRHECIIPNGFVNLYKGER